MAQTTYTVTLTRQEMDTIRIALSLKARQHEDAAARRHGYRAVDEDVRSANRSLANRARRIAADLAAVARQH